MGKSVEQWVNLTKDKKFVADEIDSKDRLGELHYEATFKKALLSQFKVKIEPVGDQAKYSGGELSRNARFKIVHAHTVNNQGKQKVKAEATITLPAAGGNEFKVKAKFKDKVLEAAKTVVVRRKLFYQVMQMQGLAAAATTSMEQAFWNPGKKYFIKMKREGPVANIPLQHKLDDNAEHNAFIAAARGAFALKAKGECAFAIVYVNYIASPEYFDHRGTYPIDLGSRLFGGSSGSEITIPVDQYLWHGIDPADDAAKKWLINGRLEFQEAGTTTWRSLPLSRDDFSVDTSTPAFAYGGHAKIKIRVDSAVGQNWFSRRKGQLRVRLDLNTAGWVNGFAYTTIPLIAMAKKVLWGDQRAPKLAYTLNHEVGHKIGMVPDGKGLLPDAPPTLYGDQRGVNDKGHQGPHCEKGAAYAGGRWSGAPGCVMFGADGVWNGVSIVDAPDAFCGECAKAVRKMDLHVTALRQGAFNQVL